MDAVMEVTRGGVGGLAQRGGLGTWSQGSDPGKVVVDVVTDALSGSYLCCEKIMCLTPVEVESICDRQ